MSRPQPGARRPGQATGGLAPSRGGLAAAGSAGRAGPSRASRRARSGGHAPRPRAACRAPGQRPTAGLRWSDLDRPSARRCQRPAWRRRGDHLRSTTRRHRASAPSRARRGQSSRGRARPSEAALSARPGRTQATQSPLRGRPPSRSGRCARQPDAADGCPRLRPSGPPQGSRPGGARRRRCVSRSCRARRCVAEPRSPFGSRRRGRRVPAARPG